LDAPERDPLARPLVHEQETWRGPLIDSRRPHAGPGPLSARRAGRGNGPRRDYADVGPRGRGNISTPVSRNIWSAVCIRGREIWRTAFIRFAARATLAWRRAGRSMAARATTSA
jgi:hypothetical protein